MYYVDRKQAVGSIKGFDNNVCLETFLDASLCGGKSVTIGADTYHTPSTKVCTSILYREEIV